MPGRHDGMKRFSARKLAWAGGRRRPPVRPLVLSLVSLLVLLLALLLTHGCGVPPRDGGLPSRVAEPQLLPGTPERWTPVRLGLTGPVDPRHAPVPTNDAERVFFRQLYENLVRIDAAGQMWPALAVEWRREDARTWVFQLRPEATFWDGSPVRSHDVRSAWVSGHARALASGRHHPWDWIESIPWPEEDDIRTLRVTLSTEVETLPAIFAHPALAVAKPVPGETFPLGSGPYRPDVDDGLRLVSARPSRVSSFWPGGSLEKMCAVDVITTAAGGDPRDLLHAGVDVLVSRQRNVHTLASELAAYTSVPLPWDRLYVFLSPELCPDALLRSEDPLSRGSLRSAPGFSLPLRAELAGEVMISDARPAPDLEWVAGDTLYDWADDAARRRLSRPGGAGTPPRVYWEGHRLPFWNDAPVTGLDGRLDGSEDELASRTLSPPRVVYPSGDADAARIAGRLAVLLNWDRGRLIDRYGETVASLQHRLRPTKTGPAPIAPGVAPEAFAELLVRGDELGYVCAIDRDYYGAWHHDCAFGVAAARPHLIARRGLVRLGLDWDGTPRFSSAGWRTVD